MLTKTVMANSLRECYANTLIQEKQDLVKVSFNGAKDACTKWEGRVLSLTGATEGYPTVESARATKEVFHPRCKHRLVAYHQDIEDVFKAVEDGKTDEEILGPAPVERPRKPKVDPWTEDAFEKIGPQQGSNPGGLYQNKITGEKWYIKRPKSEEHAQNEYLAAKLYGLAGVETPELQTIRLNDGTLGIASKWVEGIKSVKSATPDKNAFKPFHAGFGADAWLANWDVAGATFDNIAKTADGKPLRLDVGGALLFRAQGGPKGGAFTNTVTELESLRDPNVNRNTALIFGPMEKKDLVKSLKALAKVDNQTIRAAVAEAGFIGNKGVELGDKLITRRDYLLAKAKELNKYGPRKPKETEGAKELGPNDYFVQKPASAAEIAKFRQRYIGDNGYPKQYESYTRNLRQTFKSLSLEEAHAIILYTNGEYERLNNWLRDNNAPKTDNILGHALAKLINSGLKKMRVEGRTYEGEWTRDIGRSNVIMEYAKENGWMNKGSIVRMKDFLSGCPGKKGWHGDATYQLRAKLKTGTNIGEFSRHPSEREVLVEAGTRFKIVDYKYQNGIHMWYVEEI
jgi:hypothetical protein